MLASAFTCGRSLRKGKSVCAAAEAQTPWRLLPPVSLAGSASSARVLTLMPVVPQSMEVQTGTMMITMMHVTKKAAKAATPIREDNCGEG